MVVSHLTVKKFTCENFFEMEISFEFKVYGKWSDNFHYVAVLWFQVIVTGNFS